jgi:CO/xanthine dehydrogenase Mo-binding subunit
MGVAKDNYKRDGTTRSFSAAFAEVEVDLETGKYTVTEFLSVADVGVVIHPVAFGAQVLGRSNLGIAHAIGHRWIYDQRYGVGLAKRFYNNSPPTILDIPLNTGWDAVGIPDPETPVGARGIGEPPVASACSSVLNAIAHALGDEVFVRAPVLVDHVVNALDTKKPGQFRLTANV